VRDLPKNSIRRFFNAGEVREGFSRLEAMPVEEFCLFLFKNNGWITEGKVSDYFWKTYLPVSIHFDAIMSGDQAINLLHHYFSKNGEVSDALLQRLASDYPKLLITTIRLNRAFVNSNHELSLVFLKDSSDDYLKYHYYVFYELSVQDYRLQGSFSRAVYALAQPKLMDVAHHIALWFEEKRYATLRGDTSLPYGADHSMESIGLFFDHYVKVHAPTLPAEECTLSEIKESQDRILSDCLRAVESNTLHEQAVWHCLDAAADYWHFTTGIFNTYCFDLNYEIEYDQQALTVSPQSMKRYTAGKQESAKLEYWYRHKRQKSQDACAGALKAVELSLATGGDEGLEISLETELRFKMAEAVADYFSLSDSRARSVSTKNLIQTMSALNSDAFERFSYPLNNLYFREHHHWLFSVEEALKAHDSAGLVKFMTASDFESLSGQVPELPLSEEQLKDVKRLLSTGLNEAGRYNRSRPFVNLLAKPFVKINGTYISFNGMLGEGNMMTDVLVNVLDKQNTWRSMVQKQESEKMEEELARLFRDAGFKQVVFNKAYDKKNFGVAGDLDVVVYEEGLMLCLELKRSKFRVLLDEIWDELRMGILTASLQLDKAEKVLRTHLPEFKKELLQELHIETDDFSKVRFHSFIVSTSFEGDHQLIRDKHLKISLFELQETLKGYALRGEKPALEKLITEISGDTFWENRLGHLSGNTKEEAGYRFDIDRLQVHYF
jgi:hypothetical protein